MNTFFDTKDAMRMGKILLVAALFAALFLGVKFIREVKMLGFSGSDTSNVSTIDVSGSGFAFAIPDVATESFTVEQKAATVHEAQTTVTKKVNDAIAFLKKSGIAEKDIQTTNYSAYPQYSNPTPCYDRICVQSEQKIIGYTVSDTVTVKIRNTDDTGKIIDGLGALGVTGLTGPDFAVDNPDAINAEARNKAIEDAKAKADVLAKQLGVRLVRIVRFSENGGGSYPPIYAKTADMAYGTGAAASPAPEMSVGQNKYTSNVTVTYEIR